MLPCPCTPQWTISLLPNMEHPHSLRRVLSYSSPTEDFQKRTNDKLLLDFLLQNGFALFPWKRFLGEHSHLRSSEATSNGGHWREKQGPWMYAPRTNWNDNPAEATWVGFFTNMGMSSKQLWKPPERLSSPKKILPVLERYQADNLTCSLKCCFSIVSYPHPLINCLFP